MTTLGRAYETGGGVKQDYAEAVRWYRKGVEAGNVAVINSLGWMYLEGRGVAEDETEAARWVRKAAESGHTAAMTDLGWMYEKGRGVASDVVEAMPASYWCERWRSSEAMGYLGLNASWDCAVKTRLKVRAALKRRKSDTSAMKDLAAM